MKKIKFKVPKIGLLTFKNLLIFVAVVLGITQIFLSCSLSTYGEEIETLSRQQTELRRENQNLENKLANLSSLSYIRQQAEDELGMHQPDVEVFPSRRLAQGNSQ